MPSSRALQCHLCSSPCAADLHSSNWEEGSSEAGDSLSCSGVLRFPSYCNHLPRAKAEGQGCSSVPAALLKVWITEQTSECDLSKEQSSVPVSSAQRLGLLLVKHSSMCVGFFGRSQPSLAHLAAAHPARTNIRAPPALSHPLARGPELPGVTRCQTVKSISQRCRNTQGLFGGREKKPKSYRSRCN